MKRVATEDPDVVGIPLIVGVGIVGVEPHPVGVVFEVEHVRVAIGVGLLCIAPPVPPRLENLSVIPALNIIRDL